MFDRIIRKLSTPVIAEAHLLGRLSKACIGGWWEGYLLFVCKCVANIEKENVFLRRFVDGSECRIIVVKSGHLGNAPGQLFPVMQVQLLFTSIDRNLQILFAQLTFSEIQKSKITSENDSILLFFFYVLQYFIFNEIMILWLHCFRLLQFDLWRRLVLCVPLFFIYIYTVLLTWP